MGAAEVYWSKIIPGCNNDNAISWIYDGHLGKCVRGLKELMSLPQHFILMFYSPIYSIPQSIPESCPLP